MHTNKPKNLRKEYLYNSLVVQKISHLLSWCRAESGRWIEDRLISGKKSITQNELNALFEAEEVLLGRFIAEGKTDDIYTLLKLFYDPARKGKNEKEIRQTELLQKKEFDLYTQAVEKNLRLVNEQKSNPIILKSFLEALFEEFKNTEKWNNIEILLNNASEELISKHPVQESLICTNSNHNIQIKEKAMLIKEAHCNFSGQLELNGMDSQGIYTKIMLQLLEKYKIDDETYFGGNHFTEQFLPKESLDIHKTGQWHYLLTGDSEDIKTPDDLGSS